MSHGFTSDWLADRERKRAKEPVASVGIYNAPDPYAVPDGHEDTLHRDILKECARRGWIAFHGSMAHRAKRTAGEPDFHILADRGRYFAIECKTMHTGPSDEQQKVINRALGLGHTVHVVRSFKGFLEVVG